MNLALSDFVGKTDLYLDNSSTGGHSLVYKKKKSITVNVSTLDNLLQELKIGKVNIIKIDTEGSELHILKGGQKTLSQRGIKLVIETHSYDEMKQMMDFLVRKGYTVNTVMNYIYAWLK